MTDQDDHLDDVLQRSDQLDERLESADVPRAIAGLVRAARRSRAYLRLLAISLLFDIILSLAVWRVALRADNAAHQANSARQQAITLCRAGNESRKQQVQLWEFVLQISADSTPPPRTPTEEAENARRLESFRQYLRDVFAARDCQHLNPS